MEQQPWSLFQHLIGDDIVINSCQRSRLGVPEDMALLRPEQHMIWSEAIALTRFIGLINVIHCWVDSLFDEYHLTTDRPSKVYRSRSWPDDKSINRENKKACRISYIMVREKKNDTTYGRMLVVPVSPCAVVVSVWWSMQTYEPRSTESRRASVHSNMEKRKVCQTRDFTLPVVIAVRVMFNHAERDR